MLVMMAAEPSRLNCFRGTFKRAGLNDYIFYCSGVSELRLIEVGLGINCGNLLSLEVLASVKLNYSTTENTSNELAIKGRVCFISTGL